MAKIRGKAIAVTVRNIMLALFLYYLLLSLFVLTASFIASSSDSSLKHISIKKIGGHLEFDSEIRVKISN